MFSPNCFLHFIISFWEHYSSPKKTITSIFPYWLPIVRNSILLFVFFFDENTLIFPQHFEYILLLAYCFHYYCWESYSQVCIIYNCSIFLWLHWRTSLSLGFCNFASYVQLCIFKNVLFVHGVLQLYMD